MVVLTVSPAEWLLHAVRNNIQTRMCLILCHDRNPAPLFRRDGGDRAADLQMFIKSSLLCGVTCKKKGTIITISILNKNYMFF